MARYGMAIDTEHCTGCQTCVVACQMEHTLRPQVAWTRVDTVEWGRWPDGGCLHLPHGCLHCDEPACVEVCPTGASFAGDGGVSLVDHELCIGCGVCAAACPYGARTINRTDRWFFDAAVPAPYEHGGTPLGTAEKCTLCVERREAGRDPACVRSCPTGVRAFGDLDDPADPIWDFIAETGAEQLAGTATYYAHPTYARNVDVGENIRALRKPAQEAQISGGRPCQPGGNRGGDHRGCRRRRGHRAGHRAGAQQEGGRGGTERCGRPGSPEGGAARCLASS